MKIVFFGTPDYVIPVLDALYKTFRTRNENPIAAVVTQSPKPVGRDKKVEYSAVDHWAHKKGIPIYFDSKEVVEDGIEADLGIVAAYGAIIPQEVLEYFPNGLLNIHPSNLPEFRGASPVHAMLVSGKEEAVVSIMKIDELMDHGDIVTQFTEEIKSDDTVETLRTRLFERSGDVLVGLIQAYLSGKIKLKAQDHAKATFTKILTKDDGFIAWETIKSAMSAQESSSLISIPFIYTKNNGEKISYQMESKPKNIARFIRTMNPWPGAWTLIKIGDKQKRLKILKVYVETVENGQERLFIDEVQLEGKNPVSFFQFQNAYKILK